MIRYQGGLICFLTIALTLITLGFMGSCESQPEQFEPAVEMADDRPDNDIVQTSWPLEEGLENESPAEEETIQSGALESPESQNQPSVIAAPEAYYFQIGAFINKNNATRLVDKLSKKGYQPYSKTSEFKSKKWNLVRIGPFESKDEVFKAAVDFVEKEEMGAMVMYRGSVIKNIAGRKTKPVKKSTGKSKSAVSQTEPLPTADEARPAVIPYRASTSPTKSKGLFSFQIGGLYSSENAKKQQVRFERKGYSPYIIEIKDEISKERWYSVRVGSYPTLSDAVDAAAKFTEQERIPAQARPLTQ